MLWAVILDVRGVFDMTDFRSIQELLNEICSCVAIDENGNSFIRTKAGAGGSIDPTPDPNSTPDPGTSDTNTP